MTITCRVCNKSFEKNFARHIKAHYSRLNKLHYFDEFYRDCVDICKEYIDNRLSASKIASLVDEVGLFPVQKSDVLNFLDQKGITRRNTSEAITVWNDVNGGPWNKGLTKNDHSSIMAYSSSRTGKNNPIYSLTEKERQERIYYWLFKSKEELLKIREKIGLSVKENYRTGKVLHISKTNPEKAREIISAWQNGWRVAYENGLIRRGSYTSSYEKKIANALENLEIEYVQQKSIVGRYRYDFFIPEKNLLIEFNGDYWHCYPPLFESTYFHPHKRKSAQEIWDYDRSKIQHAKDHGFDIVLVWEHELADLSSDELESLIDEIVKNHKDRRV